jgi:hypothetical protein
LFIGVLTLYRASRANNLNFLIPIYKALDTGFALFCVEKPCFFRAIPCFVENGPAPPRKQKGGTGQSRSANGPKGNIFTGQGKPLPAE